jgi:Lamin Tail Domain/CHU_C Type IX secretion signal domain
MKHLLAVAMYFLSFNSSAQLNRYSIVIHEIMADPSPVVGLPSAEYIELRNVADQPIELFRWRIDNGTASASIPSYYLLQPDSVVVLCSRSQLPLFAGIPNCIGLSALPALSNAGDLITLRSSDGKTIHAVEYTLNSYGNQLKSSGGWSLEMIDPLQPCLPENWTASIHPKGGTPGKSNSRTNTKITSRENTALHCIAVSEKLLSLEWEFPMDSLSAAHAPNYFFETTNHTIRSAQAIGPLFKSVLLELSRPLDSQRIYKLQTNPIWQCKNQSKQSFIISTGIPKFPVKEDVVINEILFDPLPEGSDYIEILNRSTSIIDLRQLNVVAPDRLGRWNTSTVLTDRSINFFPGELLAFTTDTAYLKERWPASKKNNAYQLRSLPTLPDDSGRISLLDTHGNVLDHVTYDASMHAPLIRNREGVALERIHADRPSSDKSNWHSAASSSGFGTPTLHNSQHRTDSAIEQQFLIEPSSISPNNDGTDDFLQIAYRFKEVGHMLSAYLFNRQGSMIATIIDNQLCGTEGSFYWKGIDETGYPLPRGLYIILLETFHPNAKSIRFKKAIGIK